MTKITRTLSLAALAAAALSTAGLAQSGPQPGPGAQRPDPTASVTRAEAQTRAAEMFARMDQNKDGKLDAADRAARQGERFAAIDTNKDGAISKEEFAAGRPKGDSMREGRRGDRKMGGHKMGGRHGGHDRGAMMARMADANKDGTVTRDEFLGGQARMFDMMDANKDGSVSPDERKTARERIRTAIRAEHGAK
jgi:Ca2+-binding EF-hand superfamily protein